MEKRIPFSYFFACLLAFLGTLYCQLPGEAARESNRRYLTPPPELLEYFTFGFSESVADSLWLRWVQDSDVCQTYAGVGPAHPIVPDPAQFGQPRHRFCDNSWSFKMLDAVTRLAPRFKVPYEAGPITLAVVVEDFEGATVIFDRGVAMFPDDWQLRYQSAYHHLFDLNDMKTAAEQMLLAAQKGAPSWLNLLAARLYSKSGQLELGLQTLTRYRDTLQDNPDGLALVDKRIAELKHKLAEQAEKGP